MKIHALADLHLSFGRPKPMDIFGDLWRDHPARIAEAWDVRVGDDDVVLVPGDVSWAHDLPEAAPDLEYLAARRGRLKILLKGNHDSWWRSTTKVRDALPPSLAVVDADAIRLPEGVVICGARGWTLPGAPEFDPDRDARIYRRELGRLERSLDAARRLAEENDVVVAMLHFPPVGAEGGPSEVLDRLRDARVGLAVYGHLHGEDHDWAPEGVLGGVRVRFVAADFLRFAPAALFEAGRGGLVDPAGADGGAGSRR